MAFKLAQSSFETKGIFLQTNLPGSGEGRAGSCHYPLVAKGGLLRSFSQKPSLRCLNCCSSSPSSPWCLLSLCSPHHTWEWISHFPSPQLSCGRRVFLPFFDESKGGAIAQPLLPRMGCGMWDVGCGMLPPQALGELLENPAQGSAPWHGRSGWIRLWGGSTGLESWLSQGYDANPTPLQPGRAPRLFCLSTC